MSRFGKNSRIVFFIKLSVSLGLIVYLLWVIDWKQALETVNQADKLLLAVSPFFWLTSLIVASFRWRLVLADSQVEFSYRQAYTGYLIGTFYSIFLPGVIGGDAVRIGLCAGQTRCKIGTATVSVLLERVFGVFALLSILLCVSLLSPSTSLTLTTLEPTSLLTVLVTATVIVAATALLANRMWARWSSRGSVRGTWAFVHSGMQVLSTLRGRTMGTLLVLSILFQGTRIMGMFTLSRAIGLTVPLAVFFAAIPLVYLATLLPISLGGLGVREGTLVFLMAQFSVATFDAVTLSFLIYLNQVLLGGLGGLVQLIRTVSDKKTASIAEHVTTVEIPDH